MLVFLAMGPSQIAGDERQQFFKMLGIIPPPEKGKYFVPLDDFYHRLTAEERDADKSPNSMEHWLKHFEPAMQAPWSKEQLPRAASWLAANERPLALWIWEASRRPRWYLPLLSDKQGLLLGNTIVGFPHAIEGARALVARSMLRAKMGQMDEAWEDLLSGHRLARLTRQGPWEFECNVANAIEFIVCRGDIALLQHYRFTSAQAARILRDLDRLPPMIGLGGKYDRAERFAFLDAVWSLTRRKVVGRNAGNQE